VQLLFGVNNQKITRLDNNEVVEKSRNYLTCAFSFSDDWKDVKKTALFTSASGESYEVILEEDTCLVPWEVINNPHFTVSVVGGDRITANKIVINVLKSGYCEGKTPSEPTPDVYTQLINSIETPYIGDNGNWFIYSKEKKKHIDSCIYAGGNDGKDGKDGADGKDGVCYVPYVTEDGLLIWTNNGGVDNPMPVKIMGKDGKDGTDGYTPKKGVDYWTDEDKADIKAYIDGEFGDVEAVLDETIARQEAFIGGVSE